MMTLCKYGRRIVALSGRKKTLRVGTVDAFRGSWHSRQYLTKLSLGGRI